MSPIIFSKLNYKCDNIIKDITLEKVMDFKGERKDPYDLLISAICIKLTILLGTKPNELLEMKREQLDLNNNTITLNGFVVQLSDT